MITKRNLIKIIFISLFILIVGTFFYKWISLKQNINNTEKETIKKAEWKLLWSDEFEGDKLDLTKWDYEIGNGYHGWGNNEDQYYTKDNVSVANGALTIEAKNEDIGNKIYSSGRICTKKMNGDILFSTTYGKIEARIKLPNVTGLWPAFWMFPAAETYGKWPLSGEIDIMEAKGRISNQVQGSIHYGEMIPNNKKSYELYTFPNGESIITYHTYSIEWDVDKIIWYVDGKEYYSESNWYTTPEDGVKKYDYPAPFNHPFYLLLNLAVGGDFDKGAIPNNIDLPGKMEVDYVRVYKKSGKNTEDDVDLKNQVQPSYDQESSQLNSSISTSDTNNPIDIEDFDKGNVKWTAYNTNISIENINNNNVCKVEAKPTTNVWDSMLIYNNIGMENIVDYELSFRAKSSLENQLFIVTIDDSEYANGFNKEFLSGVEWKDYKYQFKIQKKSPLALKYMLGAVAKKCSFYLDDVLIREVK